MLYQEVSKLVTETLGHNQNTITGLLVHPTATNLKPAQLAEYIANRSSAATLRMTGRETVWALDADDWMPLLEVACATLINDAVSLALAS